jgi:dynein heavy chain
VSDLHFSPYITTKVVLLNFTLTLEGLEDQLLGIVVAKERPDLEEARHKLVLESAEHKKELQALEDDILQKMSTVDANFLEDDALVEKLNSAEETSNRIRKQLLAAGNIRHYLVSLFNVASEKTELEIEGTRTAYKPTATRAARLFFCIASIFYLAWLMYSLGKGLNTLDPMYQFSLESFFELFTKAIEETTVTDALDRLSALIDHFTYLLYATTCASLFEKHKLLFSVLLCVQIMKV